MEQSAGSGGSWTTTTWEHDGFTPIAQVVRTNPRPDQPNVDATFAAIVTDMIGTPIRLLDESGATTWTNTPSLWGRVAQDADGPMPLRFPGQYADAETGLHYNLFRYYDPDTGRYLTQDPLGLAPSPNPGTYPANPTAWCDPAGLAPTEGECPAAQAAEWQGQGRYPGVDQWENATLKAGTKVYGGAPGQSEFYATQEAADAVGTDAQALNEGLQIGPGDANTPFAGTYRPQLVEYTLNEDTAVAQSVAQANPQFGAGGLGQYFIPNWRTVLTRTGVVRTMINTIARI